MYSCSTSNKRSFSGSRTRSKPLPGAAWLEDEREKERDQEHKEERDQERKEERDQERDGERRQDHQEGK